MNEAVRIWKNHFDLLMKVRSKSERNALAFAMISYGFTGNIPSDLKLNQSNLILFDAIKNNFIAKKQGGREKRLANSSETVHQSLSDNRYNITDNINNNKKEKEKEKEKNNFSNEFETWWGKYPNKKSKQDALKVFSKILSSKKATFDELMRGLDAYNDECKAKKTETHYIKHPSTWLNQGCWADEYNLQSKNRYSVNDDDNAKWERLFREA